MSNKPRLHKDVLTVDELFALLVNANDKQGELSKLGSKSAEDSEVKVEVGFKFHVQSKGLMLTSIGMGIVYLLYTFVH